MPIPEDLEQALLELIAGRADDHRVMIVAPSGRSGDRLAAASRASLVLDTDIDWHRALSEQPRADLAIVLDAPEIIGSTATRRLLAWLRNVGAKAVVAAFPKTPAPVGNDGWKTGDFLALGFRRTENARTLESAYWLYRYDLYDYKITPDWLNARHWANPRRWDSERW